MPLLVLHSKASKKGKGGAHSVHARVGLFSNATGQHVQAPCMIDCFDSYFAFSDTGVYLAFFFGGYPDFCFVLACF
jgi:hypothetical protein